MTQADECHHAAAKTYKKILNFFKPKFILGLSATPERTDGEDMLELFQNIAHKMDLQTAVEKGILAPIRCIRVKTNIDLSDVRINGIKYNMQDLESKFIEYIEKMDMSYSYKPVLFLAMLSKCDDAGKARVEALVDYFIQYYQDRENKGLIVEKEASIFTKGNYNRKDVEHLIFRNPFKVVSDMSFVKRCKEIEWVMFNPTVFKKLSSSDREWIIDRCNKKLEEYYAKFL